MSSSFQSSTYSVNTPNEDEFDKNQLVSLTSYEFDAFAMRVHRQINFSTTDTLSQPVFINALRGYMYLKHTQSLRNERYLTVVDFSKSCNKKRLWTIDITEKKVVFNELVAHGARTGIEYAKYFSNIYNSNQSSLGFYTTGGQYYGRNNLSLKLNGLEKKFNSNAYKRGIVIHGANYVSESYVNSNQRIGRSYGCPAVSQKVNKELINTIQGGSCLFIYHPTLDYIENSKIMNANLYITVDDLKL